MIGLNADPHLGAIRLRTAQNLGDFTLVRRPFRLNRWPSSDARHPLYDHMEGIFSPDDIFGRDNHFRGYDSWPKERQVVGS